MQAPPSESPPYTPPLDSRGAASARRDARPRRVGRHNVTWRGVTAGRGGDLHDGARGAALAE